MGTGDPMPGADAQRAELFAELDRLQREGLTLVDTRGGIDDPAEVRIAHYRRWAAHYTAEAALWRRVTDSPFTDRLGRAAGIAAENAAAESARWWARLAEDTTPGTVTAAGRPAA
ncbi:hypothetical protein GCM10009613_55170 [Pseudonocardia kongjuensis]|uniref:TipAS antibiotic-recognition domain-containing protein n=1 Tax=Pseudonocardia kongjuensis TaxID=102227 RepID=A0ABN1Y6T4_9PSEU